MQQRILLIETNVEDRKRLSRHLNAEGHFVEIASDYAGGVQALKGTPFQAVLTAWDLAPHAAPDICRAVSRHQPGVPVIVLSNEGSLSRAIQALRGGSHDFLTKPVDQQIIKVALERALDVSNVREQLTLLDGRSSTRWTGTHGLLGESEAMQQVCAMIDAVADTPSSVVITGESGTGKELVARALHRTSNRKERPFIPLNCASVPPSLLESEIFGHEKGAFTDAKQSREGLFVKAHRGTLFLDEIGEMPLQMQVKFLRLLQERVVRPLGAAREIPSDVRVIAATHDDLEQDVDAGTFREDLYFRLNVIRIHIPPLRERGNDVLLLAETFREEFAARIGRQAHGISEEAASCLMNYDWPGNVRELRNCIERAVTLAKYSKITPDDLPQSVIEAPPASTERGIINVQQVEPLEEVERRYIEEVLAIAENNKSRAARLLQMDRRTLYRKLRSFDAPNARAS